MQVSKKTFGLIVIIYNQNDENRLFWGYRFYTNLFIQSFFTKIISEENQFKSIIKIFFITPSKNDFRK